MATRPWLVPVDIKAYTDVQTVKERNDAKLCVDISRAEQYVISYTNNCFEDKGNYPAIPESVKTATLLLAEMYARNAVEGARTLKSESFDDYSYTVKDCNTQKLEALDLGSLLDEFVEIKAKGQVVMQLRSL